MDKDKFFGKVTNVVIILMATGFICSPCFVYDKINSSEAMAKETYSTKVEVGFMQKDLEDIKKQQKTDHDILIELRTIMKGR